MTDVDAGRRQGNICEHSFSENHPRSLIDRRSVQKPQCGRRSRAQGLRGAAHHDMSALPLRALLLPTCTMQLGSTVTRSSTPFHTPLPVPSGTLPLPLAALRKVVRLARLSACAAHWTTADCCASTSRRQAVTRRAGAYNSQRAPTTERLSYTPAAHCAASKRGVCFAITLTCAECWPRASCCYRTLRRRTCEI